ncbi:hypothetical protein ACI1TM_08675 [Lactococcus garvieae]|uniref:hypothetical protein n=1 Tax=Lactococcus garvieae TaxID=1363 RepID=UPI003854C154
MFEMTIEDLRILGRQGGATARLFDGTEYIITPYEAVSAVKTKAIIAGQQFLVTQEKDLPELYPQIRTIKRKGCVIARASQGTLKATGRGYHRK